MLDVIEQEHLVENAASVGKYLLDELVRFPQIKEVRGKGLMLGLEFDFPLQALRKRLIYEQRVFTGSSGTHILRLLPPLSLSFTEADEFLHKLRKALDTA